MHHRQVIRDATVARLSAAFAAPVPNPDNIKPVPVHGMRFLPHADAALPALCVYTLRSQAAKEGDAKGHPAFRDTLTLAVEVIVASHGDARTEDDLDDLCERIENALLCNPDWIAVCLIESVESVDTDIQSGTLSAKRRYLAARISFRLTYRTAYEPAGLLPLFSIRAAVLPREPRDTTLPFPPAAWRDQAQIAVDFEPEE